MTDLTPELELLPPLTEEMQDDARFRVRDRLWAAIGDLFDHYREEQGLSYAGLARRIGRSRAQVQRWLSAPVNLTAESAGLLSEGLDADVDVTLRPRYSIDRINRAHPCEEAQATVSYSMVHSSFSEPLESFFEDNVASAEVSAGSKIESLEKIYAES